MYYSKDIMVPKWLFQNYKLSRDVFTSDIWNSEVHHDNKHKIFRNYADFKLIDKFYAAVTVFEIKDANVFVTPNNLSKLSAPLNHVSDVFTCSKMRYYKLTLRRRLCMY